MKSNQLRVFGLFVLSSLISACGGSGGEDKSGSASYNYSVNLSSTSMPSGGFAVADVKNQSNQAIDVLVNVQGVKDGSLSLCGEGGCKVPSGMGSNQLLLHVPVFGQVKVMVSTTLDTPIGSSGKVQFTLENAPNSTPKSFNIITTNYVSLKNVPQYIGAGQSVDNVQLGNLSNYDLSSLDVNVVNRVTGGLAKGVSVGQGCGSVKALTTCHFSVSVSNTQGDNDLELQVKRNDQFIASLPFKTIRPKMVFARLPSHPSLLLKSINKGDGLIVYPGDDSTMLLKNTSLVPINNFQISSSDIPNGVQVTNNACSLIKILSPGMSCSFHVQGMFNPLPSGGGVINATAVNSDSTSLSVLGSTDFPYGMKFAKKDSSILVSSGIQAKVDLQIVNRLESGEGFGNFLFIKDKNAGLHVDPTEENTCLNDVSSPVCNDSIFLPKQTNLEEKPAIKSGYLYYTNNVIGSRLRSQSNVKMAIKSIKESVFSGVIPLGAVDNKGLPRRPNYLISKVDGGIFLTSYKDLFKLDDSGLVNETLYTNLKGEFVTNIISLGDVLYVGTTNNIYKSQNDGKSWIGLDNVISSGDVVKSLYSDGTDLFVVEQSPLSAQFTLLDYKPTSGNVIDVNGIADYYAAISTIMKDGNKLYIGTVTDKQYGQTSLYEIDLDHSAPHWTAINEDSGVGVYNVSNIFRTQQGDVYVVTKDSSVYILDQNSRLKLRKTIPLSSSLISSCLYKDKIYLFCTNGRVYVFNTLDASVSDLGFLDGISVIKNIIQISGGAGVYVYDGKNIYIVNHLQNNSKYMTQIPSTQLASTLVEPYKVLAMNKVGGVIYVINGDETLVYSLDNGLTWAVDPKFSSPSGNDSEFMQGDKIESYTNDQGTLMLLLSINNSIYEKADIAGATWKNIFNQKGESIKSFEVSKSGYLFVSIYSANGSQAGMDACDLNSNQLAFANIPSKIGVSNGFIKIINNTLFYQDDNDNVYYCDLNNISSLSNIKFNNVNVAMNTGIVGMVVITNDQLDANKGILYALDVFGELYISSDEPFTTWKKVSIDSKPSIATNAYCYSLLYSDDNLNALCSVGGGYDSISLFVSDLSKMPLTFTEAIKGLSGQNYGANCPVSQNMLVALSKNQLWLTKNNGEIYGSYQLNN